MVYVARSKSTSWNVVADGIVHEVCDQSLDQFRVADHDGMLELCDPPTWVFVMGSQHVRGGFGKVDAVASQLLALAAGENE